MFVTFREMSKENYGLWIFSKIYLYLFISLFIYIVLSLFIGIISDTYERLKVCFLYIDKSAITSTLIVIQFYSTVDYDEYKIMKTIKHVAMLKNIEHDLQTYLNSLI